jgi:hypothetical protein
MLKFNQTEKERKCNDEVKESILIDNVNKKRICILLFSSLFLRGTHIFSHSMIEEKQNEIIGKKDVTNRYAVLT